MLHLQPSVSMWVKEPCLVRANRDNTPLCLKCVQQPSLAAVSMMLRSWSITRSKEIIWSSQLLEVRLATLRMSSTLGTAISSSSSLGKSRSPRTWPPWSAKSSKSSRTRQGVRRMSSLWKIQELLDRRRKSIIRDSWGVQLQVGSESNKSNRASPRWWCSLRCNIMGSKKT